MLNHISGALKLRRVILVGTWYKACQPGLYFAGLDLAVTRKSGTLLSLAEEGPRLVRHLMARCARS
jgi:hypothetical protein